MRKPFPAFRLVVCAMLAAGLSIVMVVPGQSEEKTSAREQQIAELEKQIQEMNRKLAELRHSTNGGTVAPAVEETLPQDWIKALTWRSIGPATMGGRIIALSVFEADPSTYWVATASGGLLKTVNNGITFEHQFDHESTVSIGDVCVAPSDRNIVWVGTGENNPRNSVSYGDGVYKSTDGGKTWKNMGLKQSFQIGSIKVHPKNPNIVYVGALGRLYGPNEERGLFKTTDGGETWQKILYVDDKTGVIDIADASDRPRDFACRHLRAAARQLRYQRPLQEVRPRQRPVQDHGRRQELHEVDQRAADVQPGSHGHLITIARIRTTSF